MKKIMLFSIFLFLSVLFHSNFTMATKWGKCIYNTKQIVDKADSIMFSKSSAGKMTMFVSKPDGNSTMKMKFWTFGRDKMLVKIYYPIKIKGMSTLKVHNKVWYYMQRTDRIVKVGTSMMGDSWMGSHFSNDDLVKETKLAKHYTCFKRQDTANLYVVTLKPKANAPVVWGKIIISIRKKDNIPSTTKFFSEKGFLKRTIEFKNIKQMDGRLVPTVMIIRPNRKNEYTKIEYKKIRFDVAIPNRYFTLRGLKH